MKRGRDEKGVVSFGDHPDQEDGPKEENPGTATGSLAWKEGPLVFHEDREDDFDYQIPDQDDFDL